VLERRISQSERNRLRLEDERRLFNTVASRARTRVLLTAGESHGEGAIEAARSRFAAELGLGWEPAPAGPFDEPISTSEAAATWRRHLADRSAPAATRLAAVDGLLALRSDPGRWWFQREWTDTGRPLHEQIRVSASRLQTFENCNLQFVLGDELGLEGPAGYHAWVGHLVHRLIEECEKGVIERSLEALNKAARERWRPREFPSRAVSQTFLRLVTEVMLPTWFAEYGAQPALATEQRFEFEYGDATVVGYIDRIGTAGRGSQITDYKTGRRQWGRAEENLQLGVYYLAVNHADFLEPYRPVRAVELVFLKEQDRRSGETQRLSLGFTSGNEPKYRQEIEERIGGDIAEVRSLYETEQIRPSALANCRFCSFKPLCPLFPEGDEIFHEAHR
jgi:RecB family exonuclease